MVQTTGTLIRETESIARYSTTKGDVLLSTSIVGSPAMESITITVEELV